MHPNAAGFGGVRIRERERVQDRQRVVLPDLVELVRVLLFALCRDELDRCKDAGPHRLGAIALQDLKPVHFLARLAGQGNCDLQGWIARMASAKLSRGLFTPPGRGRLTILLGLLIAVGCDRDPFRRRIRLERFDAAGRDGCRDGEFATLDLRLEGEGNGRTRLDPFANDGPRR